MSAGSIDYDSVLAEAFSRAKDHVPVQVDATSSTVVASLQEQFRAARDDKAARILENHHLRDEIAQHKPTAGYISADWKGRIAQHPLAAKEYLAWTRMCLAHLAAEECNTVSITAGHPLTRTAFHEEWMRKFDARINEAGKVLVREPRDGWDLQRDKRTIEDYLQRRIRMNGLQSRLVRRRLPVMAALANEHQSTKD